MYSTLPTVPHEVMTISVPVGQTASLFLPSGYRNRTPEHGVVESQATPPNSPEASSNKISLQLLARERMFSLYCVEFTKELLAQSESVAEA